MRKSIHVITFIILTINCIAQNRISYSQYMVNQGVFNPGYFDSGNELSGNIYYRKQWMGIDGAPNTKSLVLAYNIGNNQGLRLNIFQDNVTIFNDINLGLGYNWRTNTGKNAILSFGVLAQYGSFSGALAGVDTYISNDPAFVTITSSYLNIGFGAYWESKKMFMGLSAPYLFNNSKNAGLINPDMLFNHIYSTIGARLGDDKMQFFPTSMLKFVSGSPLQFDINANFLYRNKLWFGAGYRNDNSIVASIGMVFFDELKLIYSYDMPFFTSLNRSNGSHEITLGYGLSFFTGNFNKRKYLTKRMKYKKQKASH